MRHVIAPQILRGLVPPSTNMTLTMIKESAVQPVRQRRHDRGDRPVDQRHRGEDLERREGVALDPLATRNALAASYLSFERPAAR
jgi:hypothetical protein